MGSLFKIIKDFPWFLWSGWGAISSILLFITAWEIGYEVYGELVLPAPLATFKHLVFMLQNQEILNEIKITMYRALQGFILSFIFGTFLGLVAGRFVTASLMSRPIVTILFGMPPIAWIVLAMIWFGMGDVTVIFTVFIGAFPMVFVGALQGARTVEGELKEMVDSFGLSYFVKLKVLYFPHIFSYVFPAWVSALGMSWKIVIMAELLSTNDGIGALFAIARSHLDTQEALALVTFMIGSLLIVEYIILEPIKQEVELWRD